MKESVHSGDIDDLQEDALRELGNVGASYACTALSKLVKKNILIDVTECHINAMEGFLGRFGDSGDTVAIITIDIMTEQGSRILMIFPEEVATWLSDLMLDRREESSRSLGEDDQEALVEMGDFCIREYLNPISKFLDAILMPSAPLVTFDHIRADLEGFQAQDIRLLSENGIRIVTNFIDDLNRPQGCILFLPDRKTQQMTFERFGVDLETQMKTFAKFGL